MNFPKNSTELATLIKELTNQDVSFDDVRWFVCMQEAQNIGNWSWKDMARSLMDGDIKGIKTEEDIQGWLETCYEGYEDDTEWFKEEIYDPFCESIKEFYGE